MDDDTTAVKGIHHVTAVAGDAATNVRFYRDLLGLRLVKRTVNFDDPSSYHLYYGDRRGSPGSILTFFVWAGARRGRVGTPQVVRTCLAVPEGSLSYWSERLSAARVTAGAVTRRGEERFMAFEDPDGLLLEFVEEPASDDGFRTDGPPEDDPPAEVRGRQSSGPVPERFAVLRIRGVRLAESRHDRSESVDVYRLLGMTDGPDAGEEERALEAGRDAGRSVVTLARHDPHGNGAPGIGTVHHVAWRVADRAAQEALRERLSDAGILVSPVTERLYFTSVYFRTPGGILFEVATDGPGFTADEPEDSLGQRISLPPWLEHDREAIVGSLPNVPAPEAA